MIFTAARIPREVIDRSRRRRRLDAVDVAALAFLAGVAVGIAAGAVIT